MTPTDTITTADGRTISLSDLDAAHAAMTPGEWIVKRLPGGQVFVEGMPLPPHLAFGTEILGDDDYDTKEDDARGIVALHNAYPALVDEIRRLRERVAELEGIERTRLLAESNAYLEAGVRGTGKPTDVYPDWVYEARDAMSEVLDAAEENATLRAKLNKEASESALAHAKMQNTWAKENHEICQVLGSALGYPWFKDDPKNFPGATEENGVCVGEHVAVTIAAEAASHIATLRAEVERVTDIAAMKAEVWDQNITALRAENARLRDLLARVQVEDRWRPIDTAPKDGTPIMVLRGQWMAIAWWGKTINGHMAWCHDAGFFPSWDLPTHYRPKPLTPAEEAELDAVRTQNEEALVADNAKLRSLLHRVKRVLPPGELYAEILSVLHEETPCASETLVEAISRELRESR